MGTVMIELEGIYVKSWRSRMRFRTQEEAAAFLGISLRTYGRMERQGADRIQALALRAAVHNLDPLDAESLRKLPLWL